MFSFIWTLVCFLLHPGCQETQPNLQLAVSHGIGSSGLPFGYQPLVWFFFFGGFAQFLHCTMNLCEDKSESSERSKGLVRMLSTLHIYYLRRSVFQGFSLGLFHLHLHPSPLLLCPPQARSSHQCWEFAEGQCPQEKKKQQN